MLLRGDLWMCTSPLLVRINYSFVQHRKSKKSELNLKSVFIAIAFKHNDQITSATCGLKCHLRTPKVWENVGTSPPKISFHHRSAWVKSIFVKNSNPYYYSWPLFGSVITLWNHHILNYQNMSSLPWVLMNKCQKFNAKWWNIDRHRAPL